MYALKPNDLFLKKILYQYYLFIYLLVSFENSSIIFRISPKTCLLPTFRLIHTPHCPVHFLHHAPRPVQKVDIFCNSIRLCADRRIGHMHSKYIRKVWGHQMYNQKRPIIGRTIWWAANHRADNMMSKRKEKRLTIVHKTLHVKLKINQHEPNENRNGLTCSGNVNSSCFPSGNSRVIFKWHEHHLIWKSCWTCISIRK